LMIKAEPANRDNNAKAAAANNTATIRFSLRM